MLTNPAHFMRSQIWRRLTKSVSYSIWPTLSLSFSTSPLIPFCHVQTSVLSFQLFFVILTMKHPFQNMKQHRKTWTVPLSQSGTVEENFFFFSPSCQLRLLWLPLLSTFCLVAPNQTGLEAAMEANVHVTHMFTDISSVCDVRCWRLRSK